MSKNFCRSYLNKFVDQYNNTYHHSINKKPINCDYSAFTEKIETDPKPLRFKVNDRVRITNYKNIFKFTLKIVQEKYSLSKLILGVIRLKI